MDWFIGLIFVVIMIVGWQVMRRQIKKERAEYRKKYISEYVLEDKIFGTIKFDRDCKLGDILMFFLERTILSSVFRIMMRKIMRSILKVWNIFMKNKKKLLRIFSIRL